MPAFPLPHDPIAVFAGSRTPPGLYARQKWRSEADTPAWQSDFQTTVDALTAGRSRNGLWASSPLETIQRLFGLHLTVRDPDADIEDSLRQLLVFAREPSLADSGHIIAADRLQGLPFASAPWPDVLIPATLFLASIFGMAADPDVISRYERVSDELTDASTLAGMDPGSLHNRLRALVVHPDYAESKATRRIVHWLAERQRATGDWGAQIPFHQALNALAHLPSSITQGACGKAFAKLARMQNSDGSWGTVDREWDTFLTVHALKNRDLIRTHR